MQAPRASPPDRSIIEGPNHGHKCSARGESSVERRALRRQIALAGFVGGVLVAQPDGPPGAPLLQPERVEDRRLRGRGAGRLELDEDLDLLHVLAPEERQLDRQLGRARDCNLRDWDVARSGWVRTLAAVP